MLRIHKRNLAFPHLLTGASVFIIGMIGSIGILHALHVPEEMTNSATEPSKSRPAKETTSPHDTPVDTVENRSEPTVPELKTNAEGPWTMPAPSQQSTASTPSSAPTQSQPEPIKPVTPIPPVIPTPPIPVPELPPIEIETPETPIVDGELKL